MAMNVGSADGDEDEVVSTINTTPLVDVMLVLLIIFLITIPVVTQTDPGEAAEGDATSRAQTKPENIVIAVNKDGDVFWNMQPMPDIEALVERLKKIAVMKPQPEVHIRGDEEARYESSAAWCSPASAPAIQKIGFITEPPPQGLRKHTPWQ